MPDSSAGEAPPRCTVSCANAAAFSYRSSFIHLRTAATLSLVVVVAGGGDAAKASGPTSRKTASQPQRKTHPGRVVRSLHIVSRLLVIVSAAVLGGCLYDADFDPVGYQCTRQTDCGTATMCVQGRCIPADQGSTRRLLRLNGPGGDQTLMFPSEESDALLAQGYASDGLVLRVSTGPGESLKPLYRMFSTKPHHDFLLTESVAEADMARNSYSYGPYEEAFYCSTENAPNRPVLYRLAKAPFRHYAIGPEERAALESQGWLYELLLCRGEPEL
jgi:hypothetical protein